MAEETQGVRITQQAIYAKQLEHGETLDNIDEKLKQLYEVPAQLREVELTLARLAWIEKIAYTGLAASVVSLVGLIIGVVNR